jgi:hypothetical protein
MQIVISAEQVHTFRDWVEPFILPGLTWMIQRTVKTSREKINGIVTDNVNRVRDELLKHIDEQLKVHLDCDVKHFNDLRSAMGLPNLPSSG